MDELIERDEATVEVTHEAQDRSLEDEVYRRLARYAASLKDQSPRDLYELIMPQLERPLLRLAMELAEGRQSRAAEMLGIHRNTLRVRLDRLGLLREGST